MNTEITRVTRAQAAHAAGVSMRTISRWSAAGDIRKWWAGWPEPAEYALEDVLARANRGRNLSALVTADSDDTP